MEQSAVEWLVEQFEKIVFYSEEAKENTIKQAKEMQEKQLLEMLHKFGFDYTYNYRGEKTIYEWIPEWFEEQKRLEQLKNK
jgi:hypothetical protein